MLMQFDQEQLSYMQEQYMQLTEPEKEILRRANKSEVGRIIAKIMGPQFNEFMSLMRNPRRGLAAPR
jgi:23S rRNA maturation mini-RNase III